MLTSQIPFYIYEIQQTINKYLEQQINHITLFSFITIFISGFLTSLSPCMASSLPILISYVNTHGKRLTTYLTLILGIMTSIIAIGIIIIIFQKKTLNNLHYLSYAPVLIFIIIGFHLLEIISINMPLLNFIQPKIQEVNNLGLTYIFGISIGVNISPCSTPILTLLAIWISHTKNILLGIYFLIAYSLGYISTIVIFLISVSYFNKLRIKNELWSSLESLTGILLISTGTFSLCNIIIDQI